MGKAKPGKSTKARTSPRSASFQISQEPVIQGKTEIDVHKFEVTRGEPYHPGFEELGELPRTYGENTLYLVARDPHWLFCYWDIDWAKYPASAMRNEEFKIFLKVFSADSRELASIEINPEARNWYIPVDQANASYFVELGFYDAEGIWEPIVRSTEATTPADALSEEASAAFATLPFHFTFQRLLEMVKNSMRQGETLTQTLARLQDEGGRYAFGGGPLPEWTEEQKRLLAALFGPHMIEQANLDSLTMGELLQKFLEEKLQSESSSELVAKLKALTEASSLFSGGAWSPAEVSSLFSAIGAWKPEEISSLFSAIGAWKPAEVSSLFSAFVGWKPAEVSSLFSAFAGWKPAEVSSLFSAFAGWKPAEISSLFSAFAARPAEVSSLFSAFAVKPAEVSSLFSAFAGWKKPGEVSSLFSAMMWGPESSSLFSAMGASWSAQPFGVEKKREFFLHVNAEVIFYGGTHPDATVWIDGKQIPLNADGSFRYHFRFPDGTAEIPIVAQSPDGLEQRSATLTFKRATARRGEVGATPQPAGMPIPIGFGS